MTVKFNIKFYGIMFFGFLSVTQSVLASEPVSTENKTQFQRYDWYQEPSVVPSGTSSSGNLNLQSVSANSRAVIFSPPCSRNQSVQYSVQTTYSEREDIYHQTELPKQK